MNNLYQMTDDMLVSSYVGGCNEAFDVILQRHQAALYDYISLRLNTKSDAIDDVFQETFVKVIVSLKEGRYHPNGFFRAWLFRIAHNVVADIFRSEAQLPVIREEHDDARLLDQLEGTPYKEAELVNEQTLRDIRSLMERLPAPQREVVFMRYYEDKSFKEISQLTDTPINTCLGRMRYGILNMRKMAQEAGLSLELI